MNRVWQILANVVLDGFLLWLLYRSTIVEWDPWFAYVVTFMLVVAVVVGLIPRIHAPKVSPGSYPFDE